jgi:hypothetical protein
MRDAIVRSTANISYVGDSSVSAEQHMLNASQSIGAMVRNFSSSASNGHPDWQPSSDNVIGLDAVVVVERKTGSECRNITIALDSTQARRASPSEDNLLQLLLAGKGGEGTFVACSHPDRLAALQTFAVCNHVAQIEHIIRPDDSSDEAETLRDRLNIKRFCNGIAPGESNLLAEDNDPIRRACVPTDTNSARQTRCSLTSGDSCTSGTAGCSEGLVVALSEIDPGSSNLSISIGNRVKNDVTAGTVGLAGLQSVKLAGSPTVGLKINTIGISDSNIRDGVNLLSRRLYMMKGDNAGDPERNAEEAKLYDWVMDGEYIDHCNVDPLLAKYGLVSCWTSCWYRPLGYNMCSDTDSVWSLTATPACVAHDQPNHRLPSCRTGMDTCCSTGSLCPESGICPAKPALGAGYACSLDTDCSSGQCQAGVCQ